MSQAELNAVFLEFRDASIWLRICFNMYSRLFEHDIDGTSELLRKKAGIFFRDISVILMEYCVLQVSKLTDPAVAKIGKGGKPEKYNISNRYIDRELINCGLMTVEIQKYSKSLLQQRKLHVDIRNEYISHLDRDALIINKAWDLGSRESLNTFFVNLQRYCDAVGEVIGLGPLDFSVSAGPGDVEDLVRALQLV